jgi:adenine-specific DNA-methyltransferase
VTKVKTKKKTEESVDQYIFDKETRKNNPPVGLVTPGTDPDQPSKKYQYDPRLDPNLQWSGKQENSEFEVDTVSLHVHERIDPLTIIEKTITQKKPSQQTLFHYFETPENNPPLRDAIEFYKHDQNWSNRIIAGDSLLVMNSLLEKEGMEGKVQMIYMDPPYGIKYGSNFQPFVNKRDVKDGKDEDLTQEPETIKAFRDTWELGIHSYLTYLRNRLLLAHKLLNEQGSVFVQISDDNIQYVKQIMEEIFGKKNFISLITLRKASSASSPSGRTAVISSISDYLIWFGKNSEKTKYHPIFLPKKNNPSLLASYSQLELSDGTTRSMTLQEKQGEVELPKKSRCYTSSVLYSQSGSDKTRYPVTIDGVTYRPPSGVWKTSEKGMQILIKKNRIIASGKRIYYKRYLDDFSAYPLTNLWADTWGATEKIYAVQTSNKIIQRCILMTTDPGDLVFDPTCGSGTTGFVSEQWGRRWILCDTSRVATSITKQRIMTAKYDHYVLKNPEKGMQDGFRYKEIPHITLKSIANNEDAQTETLYDNPEINKSKIRISGPFTVEAVPSPTVRSMDVLSEGDSKSSELTLQNKTTSPQEQWRDELLKTGIRGKSGQKIEFSRVLSHPATKWLHADAETKEDSKRVMISFGPEHAPLEQRQVALAIEEAQSLVPKPTIIIFAAMQFDPEAAKDIDELNWPDVTILKVEMNKDLLTLDLKKKRSNNESFWLMGQPDIEIKKTKDKKYVVTVNGFDYYNTKTGEVESGDSSRIVMWMIDTDYDGRSVYPQQVFFPMGGKTGGWNKLAKTLQTQVDEELISKYQGTESIPFEVGFNKRVAIKIIDDRGIESLKIMKIE